MRSPKQRRDISLDGVLYKLKCMLSVDGGYHVGVLRKCLIGRIPFVTARSLG